MEPQNVSEKIPLYVLFTTETLPLIKLTITNILAFTSTTLTFQTQFEITEITSRLSLLTGETLQERTANRTEEARLNIAAKDFWVPGQKAFFDVRVSNPLAGRYGNSKVSKAYEINEKVKKRAYNERVFQVEQGSFTPLVFNAIWVVWDENVTLFTRS